MNVSGLRQKTISVIGGAAVVLLTLVVGVADAEMPPAVAAFELSAEDRAIGDPEEMAEYAEAMLSDSAYDERHAMVTGPLDEFEELIEGHTAADVQAARDETAVATVALAAAALGMAIAMLGLLVGLHRLLAVPVGRYVRSLQALAGDDLEFQLELAGSRELRDLGAAFNAQLRNNA